jgi:hypothetical protein
MSLAGLACLALLNGCAETPSKPVDLMTGDEMGFDCRTVEGTSAGGHYKRTTRRDVVFSTRSQRQTR